MGSSAQRTNLDQDSTPGLSVEIVKLEQLPDERVAPGYSCGFAYTIKVENGGNSTVRLQSRKWMIKHSDGNIETVEGDGVVGQQPSIEPGEQLYLHKLLPAPRRALLDVGLLFR